MRRTPRRARGGFDTIREAYPWEAPAHVSAHNDPNPQNILFDGERLWLIDWETAYANDPLTDVAILTDNFAPTPELEASLLSAWLGAPPDRTIRARLQLMRQLTRLYYAGLILSMFAGAPRSAPDADFTRRAWIRSAPRSPKGALRQGHPR